MDKGGSVSTKGRGAFNAPPSAAAPLFLRSVEVRVVNPTLMAYPTGPAYDNKHLANRGHLKQPVSKICFIEFHMCTS